MDYELNNTKTQLLKCFPSIEVHCQLPVKANQKSSKPVFFSCFFFFTNLIKAINLLIYGEIMIFMNMKRKPIKFFSKTFTSKKCEIFPGFIYVCDLDQVCTIVSKDSVLPI